MQQQSNFWKWLIFAFPYLAILLNKIILFVFSDVFIITLDTEAIECISALCNSLAILLGLGYLQNTRLFKLPKSFLSTKNHLKK